MLMYYIVIVIGAVAGGFVFGPVIIEWCKEFYNEVINREDDK